MSPLEDEVLEDFITALLATPQVDTALAEAIRAELTSPKGPNAERLAALIRDAAEGAIA